jgi:hypothetical protein
VVDWFFDFLMGQDLDEPVSVWDEMFLPVEIGRNISAFRYTGEGGRERALVSAVELVNAAKNRPPNLHRPPDLRPRSFLLGLAAASAFAVCGALRKKYPRGGGILWGAVNVFAGLALGLAGSVLFFGLCFMPNDYIQQNANILFVNPLLLAAVPLGVFTALGKGRKFRGREALPLFWALVFAAGCLSVLMKALPPFFQQNGSVQALILPPVFVLAFWRGKGTAA